MQQIERYSVAFSGNFLALSLYCLQALSMLALHKSLASAKTPQEKESVQRQIESTDRAIDKLVYELYGLSEDEVKIVEGKLL